MPFVIDYSSPAALGGAGILAGQARAQELQNQRILQQQEIDRQNALRLMQLDLERRRMEQEAELRAAQINNLRQYQRDQIDVRNRAIDSRENIAVMNDETRRALGQQRSDDYNYRIATANDIALQKLGLDRQKVEANIQYMKATTDTRALHEKQRHEEVMARLQTQAEAEAETVRYHKAIEQLRATDQTIRQQGQADANARFNAEQQNIWNRAIATAQRQDARYHAGQMNADERREYAADRTELNRLNTASTISEEGLARKQELLTKFATGKWAQGLNSQGPAPTTQPAAPQTVPVRQVSGPPAPSPAAGNWNMTRQWIEKPAPSPAAGPQAVPVQPLPYPSATNPNGSTPTITGVISAGTKNVVYVLSDGTYLDGNGKRMDQYDYEALQRKRKSEAEREYVKQNGGSAKITHEILSTHIGGVPVVRNGRDNKTGKRVYLLEDGRIVDEAGNPVTK